MLNLGEGISKTRLFIHLVRIMLCTSDLSTKTKSFVLAKNGGDQSRKILLFLPYNHPGFPPLECEENGYFLPLRIGLETLMEGIRINRRASFLNHHFSCIQLTKPVVESL